MGATVRDFPIRSSLQMGQRFRVAAAKNTRAAAAAPIAPRRAIRGVPKWCWWWTWPLAPAPEVETDLWPAGPPLAPAHRVCATAKRGSTASSCSPRGGAPLARRHTGAPPSPTSSCATPSQKLLSPCTGWGTSMPPLPLRWRTALSARRCRLQHTTHNIIIATEGLGQGRYIAVTHTAPPPHLRPRRPGVPGCKGWRASGVAAARGRRPSSCRCCRRHRPRCWVARVARRRRRCRRFHRRRGPSTEAAIPGR